jgi:hypothetical protein
MENVSISVTCYLTFELENISIEIARILGIQNIDWMEHKKFILLNVFVICCSSQCRDGR